MSTELAADAPIPPAMRARDAEARADRTLIWLAVVQAATVGGLALAGGPGEWPARVRLGLIAVAEALAVGGVLGLLGAFRAIGRDRARRSPLLALRALLLAPTMLAWPLLFLGLESRATGGPPPRTAPGITATGQSAGAIWLGETGARLWYNRYFGQDIESDMEYARKEGIVPVSIVSPEALRPIARDGRIFKWVLSEDYRLLALPHSEVGDRIKHVMMVKGCPVRTAGLGRMTGANTVMIDARSGHYRPDVASLGLAKVAFEDAGLVVEVKPDGVAEHK